MSTESHSLSQQFGSSECNGGVSSEDDGTNHSSESTTEDSEDDSTRAGVVVLEQLENEQGLDKKVRSSVNNSVSSLMVGFVCSGTEETGQGGD